MKNAKAVYSIRLDEWTADELSRVAETQGIAPRLLARQLIEQGLSNYNILSEHMSTESGRITQAIERLEAIALGHLVFATAAQEQGNMAKFQKTLVLGRKVQEQLRSRGDEMEG